MIPGWPYSLVAALEPGRTSWTRLLDAVRLGPGDDLAAVTAAQVRGVIERIIAAGHWHGGDPDIMVIFDAGCEVKLCDDAGCPGPDVHTTTQTSRYGAADARAWHRMHPRLKARGAWAGHQGKLPVIEASPGPARPPDPRTGPAGIPGHPRHTARSHSRTETRQTRPRQTSRLEEPAPGHPPRRGQGRIKKTTQETTPNPGG
jgi:hypothetical protein